MNCKTYERWALLEASRELDSIRRRMLTRHCARCSDCARFRDTLPDWIAQAQAALDIGEAGQNAARHVVHSLPPSPETATSLFQPRRIFALPLLSWRPLAAVLFLFLAAGGLILGNRHSFIRHSGRIESSGLQVTEAVFWQFEVDLLDETLTALSRNLEWTLPESPAEVREEQDKLATELLRMEESA